MPQGFPDIGSPPLDQNGLPQWLRRFWLQCLGTQQGKLNNTSTITLVAASAATTVVDDRIGPDSQVFLAPRTLNAAAALATTYQDTTLNGSAVLVHAIGATTNRTFGYAVIG